MPGETDSRTECQNCGETVTLQFARVFGDNSDVPHGCPECMTYRRLKHEAAYPGGESE